MYETANEPLIIIGIGAGIGCEVEWNLGWALD